MATLVGVEGQSLATVTLGEPDESRPHALPIAKVVEGGGRLLRYYFGESGRAVRLVLGDFRLGGRLKTRLDGPVRHWEIQLEPTHMAEFLLADSASAAPRGFQDDGQLMRHLVTTDSSTH